MSPALVTIVDGAMLTVGVLLRAAQAEGVLAAVVVALAVAALAMLALAEAALAFVMLPAECSAVSMKTVYLATVDGGGLPLRCLRGASSSCTSTCCHLKALGVTRMLLEAATGRSKYCGTVMSRLSDGTQWTVMVKLVIAMMQIAIPRPWSDLRCYHVRKRASSACPTRGARVRRERGRGHGTVLPKTRQETRHESAHNYTRGSMGSHLRVQMSHTSCES